MNTLSSSHYEFFEQIATLAFINPFSQEREQADCQLLKIKQGTLNLFQRQDKIQERLKQVLQEIQQQRTFNIQNYAGKTQDIMRLSWLFYQYHVFQQPFVEFIQLQKKAGEKTIELPFADRLIQVFTTSSFPDSETRRYIALFYQLHRGFNFINDTVSGSSQAMVELRKRLWNNIFTFNPQWYLLYLCERMEDFSLLLLGETGTGKSLVANAIGCSGFIPFDLKKRCFVESFIGSFNAINLSQYPAGLLESELFGHKRGAFTGAIENHQGLFAKCSCHGSVFIDEIGEIDIPTQVKLLNVIQDRVFSPVGSHEKKRFEGRVISATNQNIQRLITEGQFRSDLYYRLCSDVIVLPSLRERLQENPKELRDLVERLIKRIITSPQQELIDRIEIRIRKVIPENYSWPGNVRELEQCIRRICLTGTFQVNPIIDADKDQEADISVHTISEEMTAHELLKKYCNQLFTQYGTYQAVSRITNLDRRTVKKYIDCD